MSKKLISCLLCVGMLFCVPAVFSQTAFYSAVYAAEYDADTIASVQNALNDAGFECGTADGVAGSKTQEAIRQYQEANGLTASGEIDDELLVSLGLVSGSEEDLNEEANESADEPAPESSEDFSEAGNLADESAQADSLLHLETDYGEYDFLGVYFELFFEDCQLNLIMEYRNTSSEPNYVPYIAVTPFQDGVSLESAGYHVEPLDTEWGEADYPYDKEIQPGESVVYYIPFLLSSNSEIEIDITVQDSSYKDDQSGSYSYTIECDESAASKLSAPEEMDFDAESESLLHMNGEGGTYDLLGYMFDSSDMGTEVYVFSRYENTSDDTSLLSNDFYLRAYQDGVSMDGGFNTADFTDTEWEKAGDASRQVKPGASLICYTSFQLSSDSEIELDVASYDMDKSTAEEESYMIECDESVTSGLGSAVDDDAVMDSLLHVENEYGAYDLVGCYYTINNFTGEETEIFYVFTRFENTSGDTVSPRNSISISAYQDGEELNSSGIYTSLNDTEWAKARTSSKYVKPGASMIYYTAFALSGDSDIEVQILNYGEEDNPLGSYTFTYGEW